MHPAAFKCKEVSIGVIVVRTLIFIYLFCSSNPYHQVKESVVVNISAGFHSVHVQ